jgi:hypothetical protein
MVKEERLTTLLSSGLELYKGLKEYMYYYNYELHHQGIERKTLAELYRPAA